MADLIAPIMQASRTAKVLIVDDDPYVLSVLYSLLSSEHECRTASSAIEALEYLREEEFDLVLSDIMMPGMSGLELLEHISSLNCDTVVVLISANLQIQSAIEAMRRGAFDYVTKPFNLEEVEASVRRALRHRLLIKANREYERHLEEMVKVRTYELNETVEKLYLNYRATLRSLAAALEARDIETRGHSERVVAYCVRLGRQLKLDDREIVQLEHGALLHDIGKIGVPDSILLKRGPLTEEEWQQMRRHVEYGAQILKGIDFLEGAAQIVKEHHERFDGSGYPRGLAGEQICLGARIFAVADTVDAITSNRPYRSAQPFEAAAEELVKNRGKLFDPKVVDAFLSVPMDSWRELRLLANELRLEIKDGSGREIKYSAISVNSNLLLKQWG
jgi:putative nucleotidyltransferase with HDIG domain